MSYFSPAKKTEIFSQENENPFMQQDFSKSQLLMNQSIDNSVPKSGLKKRR